MAFNILDTVALAYQPIWGASRQMTGVRLRVRTVHSESVDAAHFLHVLSNEWSEQAPYLLVSFADTAMLLQALSVTPHPEIWLELPDAGDFLAPDLQEALALARRGGHQLVQCAPLARARLATSTPEQRYLLDLWPEQAALALQAAGGASLAIPHALPSPVLPHQLYQQIGSQALAAHCLDDRHAWGICGWPQADTLHHYREFGVPADRQTIVRVQEALQKDVSMEVLETLIHQDVVLTYRLLRLVNSAVFGAHRQVETIRQAVMLLGQRNLRDWLQEQAQSATDDADLSPVRQSLVLRARLMEHLLDPGPEHDLRAEIYLTGLFSELDQVMQEPLGTALGRVPLSDQVGQALLHQDGPYYPYLDVVRRLEGLDQIDQLPAVCAEHEFALDEVNRALIRTLAHWHPIG